MRIPTDTEKGRDTPKDTRPLPRRYIVDSTQQSVSMLAPGSRDGRSGRALLTTALLPVPDSVVIWWITRGHWGA